MRPMGKFGISGLDCNYHGEELSSSLGLVCKQTTNKHYAARQTIEQPFNGGPSGMRLGCFCFFHHSLDMLVQALTLQS